MDADERGSECINNPLYLKPWLPEVNDQANTQVRCPQIVQALGTMNRLDGARCLQLHHYTVLDQQIRRVVTHDNTFLGHLHVVLLLNFETCPPKLHRQCILIDFLQEPNSQGIADLERTTDDGFGHFVQSCSAFIRVHRRLNTLTRIRHRIRELLCLVSSERRRRHPALRGERGLGGSRRRKASEARRCSRFRRWRGGLDEGNAGASQGDSAACQRVC